MTNHFFTAILLFAWLLPVLTSCQRELPDPNLKALSAREHGTQQGAFSKVRCTEDSSCLEIDLRYTTLTGPDAQAVSSINKVLLAQHYLLSGADTTRPLEQSLDSIMLVRVQEMSKMKAMMPAAGALRMKVLVHSKDLMLTDKFYSCEIYSEIPLGFKKSLDATGVYMFDLQTGRQVQLEALVSDTEALMALVEEAYLADKKEFAPNGRLSEVIFDKKEHLPLPKSYCIVPEGLRITYKNVEVAPIQVGGFDTVLSWERVADLVRWKEWLPSK